MEFGRDFSGGFWIFVFYKGFLLGRRWVVNLKFLEFSVGVGW